MEAQFELTSAYGGYAPNELPTVLSLLCVCCIVRFYSIPNIFCFYLQHDAQSRFCKYYWIAKCGQIYIAQWIDRGAIIYHFAKGTNHAWSLDWTSEPR